jgi:hypothetical protein
MLVFVALGCMALSAQAWDGGKDCKFMTPAAVQKALRKTLGLAPTAPIPPATYIATMKNLANTNNYLCAKCVSIGTTKTQKNAVLQGYGQCTCTSTYGSYSYIVGGNTAKGVPGVRVQGFGCSKCPKGKHGSSTFTGSSANTVGPYAPSAKTWTGTKCL